MDGSMLSGKHNASTVTVKSSSTLPELFDISIYNEKGKNIPSLSLYSLLLFKYLQLCSKQYHIGTSTISGSVDELVIVTVHKQVNG